MLFLRICSKAHPGRILFGAHYPSDVATGIIISTVVTMLAFTMGLVKPDSGDGVLNNIDPDKLQDGVVLTLSFLLVRD